MARAATHLTLDNNNNNKYDAVSFDRIKPAVYKPHFSSFTSMHNVRNNHAATAPAVPRDLSSRPAGLDQTPTTTHYGQVECFSQHFQEFEFLWSD